MDLDELKQAVADGKDDAVQSFLSAYSADENKRLEAKRREILEEKKAVKERLDGVTSWLESHGGQEKLARILEEHRDLKSKAKAGELGVKDPEAYEAEITARAEELAKPIREEHASEIRLRDEKISTLEQELKDDREALHRAIVVDGLARRAAADDELLNPQAAETLAEKLVQMHGWRLGEDRRPVALDENGQRRKRSDLKTAWDYTDSIEAAKASSETAWFFRPSRGGASMAHSVGSSQKSLHEMGTEELMEAMRSGGV